MLTEEQFTELIETLQGQSTLISQSTDVLLQALYWSCVIGATTMFFCIITALVVSSALMGGRD